MSGHKISHRDKIFQNPLKTDKILNGIEKRFERIERRMDEHDNIISIHTKIMGLQQDALYRDEKNPP
ncbi:MAG: hypothetical protein A2017_13540 [Lentisphaerae bacterium GWF2_44_16]|nr:MAG: hypothetical protein A2017_13540 [Lentisphaerae bacterium GWF2_44_16]